ncbi:MAG: YaiI/YqxD family protein [Planctomycetaceae bacterium]|jgi:uncharacterized protein|nr:YaiI/YqxD family protein [Planctomycetaceae bacterium]
MQIWVDADACPRDAKELLYKTAKRTETKTIFVANQQVRVPGSKFLETVLVTSGANVADQKIVELMQSGDLVITADIPLAADVVEKGGLAINPRGELYTDKNIGERLAVRDLMDGLRGGGEITGGPSNYSDKDRQAFANQLDRSITAAKKSESSNS